ncbi:MAG: hypothetical protein ACXVCY_06035 [Pseudobdellovibrionaceae bacterium]
MKSLIAILAVATLPSLALADSKWVGTGEEFTPDGTSVSIYEIVVTNTDLSAGVTMSRATITYPNGSQHVTNQKITQSNKGWSSESDFGKGGGSCYGKDICLNYIQGQNGAAIATTIIEDSDIAKRDVSILLENGKAVKIFKDKLTKVQQ